MTRLAVAVALLLSAVLAGALVALPHERSRAVAAYLVALAALAALVELAALRRARGLRRSAFAAALVSEPVQRYRLRELEQLEHDVAQALRNPRDLDRRLRPLLREIATKRLTARHGVDLARNPEAARALLGEDAWALVRPECAEETVDAARFDRAVTALERV